MSRFILLGVLLGIFVALIVFARYNPSRPFQTPVSNSSLVTASNPLQIEVMRRKSYPGSNFVIEETLSPGVGYSRYIVSYASDGLKIYGLLTIPRGSRPSGGFPAIIFNHGYIAPREYQTTERYGAYVDAFARADYVVFKPDFRGNGNSEGSPEGAYYSPAYTTDSLNALAGVARLKDPSTGGQVVNPHKIGMWGHSMGGNITMRALVVAPHEIRAAVIWSGVVGSIQDLLIWHDPKYRPSPYELSLRNRYRAELIQEYGMPDTNPAFWASLDPHSYFADSKTPVQVHASFDDEEVPVSMAEHFASDMKRAGKTVELYTYQGADHNLSQVFDTAMSRSVAFFDTYLK